jgi:cyclopropane fatty-acyl-phospholipid synthase-like methyltransferase
VDWVKSRKDRIAVGVDLDHEPLQWCREHFIPKLKPQQQERLTLLEQDVRTSSGRKFDIIAAQNFSFFLFKTRDLLREYFEYVLGNLADDGLLIMDMMGGSECQLENHTEKRKKKGFVYYWEQLRFDPITHDAVFAIHFKFPDGSKWNNAFTYDWRLWGCPEVRELLLEAGFSKADVLWEGTDENNEGDSKFKVRKNVPADPSWIAYVVAQK